MLRVTLRPPGSITPSFDILPPASITDIEYRSGSKPMILRLDEFTFSDATCGQPLSLRLSTDWSDGRYKTQDAILNFNEQVNSIIVRAEAIKEPSVLVTVTVAAQTSGETPLSNSYSFKIEILPNERGARKYDTPSTISPPQISLSSISTTGLIKLAFSEPVLVLDKSSDKISQDLQDFL